MQEPRKWGEEDTRKFDRVEVVDGQQLVVQWKRWESKVWIFAWDESTPSSTAYVSVDSTFLLERRQAMAAPAVHQEKAADLSTSW